MLNEGEYRDGDQAKLGKRTAFEKSENGATSQEHPRATAKKGGNADPRTGETKNAEKPAHLIFSRSVSRGQSRANRRETKRPVTLERQRNFSI